MLQRYKNILTKHLRPAILYIYLHHNIYLHIIYNIFIPTSDDPLCRRPDIALCGPNHSRKKILKNSDCPGFLRCVILHRQKSPICPFFRNRYCQHSHWSLPPLPPHNLRSPPSRASWSTRRQSNPSLGPWCACRELPSPPQPSPMRRGALPPGQRPVLKLIFPIYASSR